MQATLQKNLSKFFSDQVKMITNPRVSIAVKVNRRLSPLTRAERISLASHQYVILDGSDRQHLQLYYHDHGYGCTPYPLKNISSKATHFKLADIIGLRDHLITLPFSDRLIRAMEAGVISIEQFRSMLEKR